jgi:hypothetical protein
MKYCQGLTRKVPSLVQDTIRIAEASHAPATAIGRRDEKAISPYPLWHSADLWRNCFRVAGPLANLEAIPNTGARYPKVAAKYNQMLDAAGHALTAWLKAHRVDNAVLASATLLTMVLGILVELDLGRAPPVSQLRSQLLSVIEL